MDLGDRMKLYESLTESRLMPQVPFIVRIDGRAFHTLTRGLKRPYDEPFSNLMVETTKELVKEFKASVGYTQSDEISMLFPVGDVGSDQLFGGRVQKICSVFAGYASAIFNRLNNHLMVNVNGIGHFDCRVFQVPNASEVINYFLWRERDAIKNSISMAAQSVYSHTELLGKNGSEQQEMLFQKGINWNDYPSFFKRGSWIKQVLIKRKMSISELNALPEHHEARKNPNLLVTRTDTRVVQTEDLSKMNNGMLGNSAQEDFLFSRYFDESRV